MAIRALVVVALLVGSLAACGSERHEVFTNSGGVLDCHSDTILYVMMDAAIHTGGSPTAEEAVDRIGEDSGRPAGNPTVETSGAEVSVFTFLDDEGNRVGRVTTRKYDGGWFVQSTERCD